MNHNKNLPTPENIMKIGSGFWASKILLTAIDFELFTRLAKGKSSGKELKKTLGLNCSDRHFYDFMDSLTSFGFLEREGILETAIYSNTPDTDMFLDKNKLQYIGGILEMYNQRLYMHWHNLGEGLKTGQLQNEAKNNGESLFDTLYKSPDLLRNFVNAMSSIQVGNFIKLSQEFDFSNYNTLLDVGGSAGIMSAMIAKKHNHMNCISFDLPAVESIAQETIKKHELETRVKAVSGDFFTDTFPKADVVTMGNILHDWNEETKLMLMQKAYDALPIGGAFIAVENIIDNERKSNSFGLMMSLNMLIETGEGFDYTFNDFNSWAKKIGFKTIQSIPLNGPTSAAIAYK